jgi:hypothetical protein
MFDLMVQIIDSQGGGRRVVQTTWVTVDSPHTAKVKADAIVDAAPSWLGGDTVELNQEGRTLSSRPFGANWRS